MTNQEVVTVRGTVTGLVPGSPPTLAFYQRLSVMGGKEKTFTQWLKVPDDDLFRRLQEQVRPGDEIEVTVTTDWDDEDYDTYLTDFTPPITRPEQVEPAVQRSEPRRSTRQLPA